jgi:hypothetical protein
VRKRGKEGRKPLELKRELFVSPGQKLLRKKRGKRTRPWDEGSKEGRCGKANPGRLRQLK